MIEKKYPALWQRVKYITKTCPINDVEDGCLTFAKTRTHLKSLLNVVTKRVDVIVPFGTNINTMFFYSNDINFHILKRSDDVKNIFIQLHNIINKNKDPKENVISSTAVIDPTAVIGASGNNITKMANGRIINMKHMGNVVIGDYAEVQALSVVHRAAFASTIIRKNAQIFAKVNIGHNCDIGESTIICPGTMLAGGTKVGDNCYIWQGVITRSNITICDNVIIGAGSLVLKSIIEPGVYLGSPAKYIKPYQEELR